GPRAIALPCAPYPAISGSAACNGAPLARSTLARAEPPPEVPASVQVRHGKEDNMQKVITVALLAVASAGGAQRTLLSPAPGSPGRAAVTPTAIRADGVQVTVEGEEPSGPREIMTAVTPLKVTITNGGATPVALRYDRISLEGPDGKRWAALPPY